MGNSRNSARADAWAKAAFALALIWSLAGAGVFVARSLRPTAASAITFLRQHDTATLGTEARTEAMREAARRLNLLTFEQAREVRISRALFIFYRPLTPAEKERFAAMIVPTGLRRILAATRAQPPEQRAAFLEHSLYHGVLDLSIAEPPIDFAALQRIELAAVKACAADLTSEERIEMEPLFQQMRSYLQQPQQQQQQQQQ